MKCMLAKMYGTNLTFTSNELVARFLVWHSRRELEATAFDSNNI